MRFGIMSMQMDALLPSRPPEGDLMEHLATLDLSSVVQNLARAGFKLIERGNARSFYLPGYRSPAGRIFRASRFL
jgi:hypothetical protein